MIKLISGVFLIVIGSMFFNGAAYSQSDQSQPTDQPQPTQVIIGTYVQNIVDLNLRTNNVTVDFYMWFRWKGDQVKPHETFEISNGKINSKSILDTKVIGDENFSQVRVNATLYTNWNLERFTLDRQIIPIMIEDSAMDISKLLYSADTPNISVRKSTAIPGYVVDKQQGSVAEDIYLTNFGDPDLPQRSVYSQYNHQIEIERPDYGYFFKLFGSMILATILAPLGFALKTDSIDSRLGLSVGSIFGVFGTNFSIAGQLPPTSLLTLADKIFIISIVVIVFCTLLAVVNWRLNANTATTRLAKKLDHLGLAIPLIYIMMVIFVVFY